MNLDEIGSKPRDSIPDGVYDFINGLTPDDAGMDRVDGYRVHYEGFTDMCNAAADERRSLPADDPAHLPDHHAVYDEVLRDFIEREHGTSPIDHGLAGSVDNPIVYAVFPDSEQANESETKHRQVQQAIQRALRDGRPGDAISIATGSDMPREAAAAMFDRYERRVHDAFDRLMADGRNRTYLWNMAGDLLQRIGVDWPWLDGVRMATRTDESWSNRYKKSINCSNPKGFSQKAHCAARRKRAHGGKTKSRPVREATEILEAKKRRAKTLIDGMVKTLMSRGRTRDEALADLKKQIDARFYEAIDAFAADEILEENLRDWFKQKWVRFGPDGKIRGACARGSGGEGKPKCLPQKKAHALGKKGRASAARRKRREDPDPERHGKARNVRTREGVAEAVTCPHCGGMAYGDQTLAEKKDACYYKVKSRYKVWPSAYASGALVQCRKKGAKNWGKGRTNEGRDDAVQDLMGDLGNRHRELASVGKDERYDRIDAIMQRVAKANGISAKELHDAWMERFKELPDHWVLNEEKLTRRDPVEVWIRRFKDSTHPKFRGKTPAEREKMARMAHYRAVQNYNPFAAKKVAGKTDDLDELRTESESSQAPTGVIFNGNVAYVGQTHGKPIKLSNDIKKKIQDMAAKYGAWYEGNGADRAYTNDLINKWEGSWDDVAAASIKGYPPEFLYVLFSNVDANNTIKRVGVDPRNTIFNQILKNQNSGKFFPDRSYDANTLREFLSMVSQEGHDFNEMAQQPATAENVERFLKTGEKLMWPSNWEDYPNPAGKVARKANDHRDHWLAARKSGVYVMGAGHLLSVAKKGGLKLIGGESINDTQVSEVAKVRISKDPNDLGAYVDDEGEPEPTIGLALSRITSVLEPDEQHAEKPGADARIARMVKAIEAGKSMPAILVRRHGDGYQVLDGHHRFKAYRKAGAKTIPARIVDPENITGDIFEESDVVPAQQVLDYVKGIHPDGEFNIDHVITDHPRWTRADVPIGKLHIFDPEDDEVADPYNRVQDTDLYHVKKITPIISDILRRKPIVIDDRGYVLDGNHRALAARNAGLKYIPVWMPANGSIDENFADGKVKGKSRPGRVKRAGASCKGSVTSLRAKARKYGGERGKMYHWCANMKGGKVSEASAEGKINSPAGNTVGLNAFELSPIANQIPVSQFASINEKPLDEGVLDTISDYGRAAAGAAYDIGKSAADAAYDLGSKAADSAAAFGRSAADVLTLGGYKYARAYADYIAKQALKNIGYGSGTTYDRELRQEIEKLVRDETENPEVAGAGKLAGVIGAAVAPEIPVIGGVAAGGYKAGEVALKAAIVYKYAKQMLGLREGEVVRTAFGMRQAARNRTPYRFNPDIAASIPLYDPEKRFGVAHKRPEHAQGGEVPFDRFEVNHKSERTSDIVGVIGDKRVVVSTTRPDIAEVLADAYNRGGFTAADIEMVREDGADKQGAALTVFDMDETLFHTKARVYVVRDGEVLHRLTNQEYNTYQLKPGETYDYREFRDARFFHDTSVPIERMWRKAQNLLDNIGKRPGSRVIIVTARTDLDDRETFLNTFRKHGLDIDKVHVHRAGNLPVPAAAAKKAIIATYLNSGKFDSVRLIDDAESNLKSFLSLRPEYPEVRFTAYLVLPGGHMAQYQA